MSSHSWKLIAQGVDAASAANLSSNLPNQLMKYDMHNRMNQDSNF